MDRTCRFDYRRGPLALVLGGGTVGLVFAAVCLVAGLVWLAGESAAGVVDGPRDRRNRLVKDDLFKEPPLAGRRIAGVWKKWGRSLPLRTCVCAALAGFPGAPFHC